MQKYTNNVNNNNNNPNEDYYQVFKQNNVSPLGYMIPISIRGAIGPSYMYEEDIYKIKNAGPNDIIHMEIMSEGGELFTALDILAAMQQTQAKIITENCGLAASAASMLLFSGDEIIINPLSVTMVHSATYGTIGMQENIYQEVQFNKAYLEDVFKSIYSGLFTDEEIKDIVINCKQHYMKADETLDRLNKRAEKQKESQIEEMKKCGCEECKQTLSMIAPDSLDLEDFLDEDYPTREELETWEKSDLIDFILGEDIEEDSENSIIPVDVTLSCTPTEEDVYGAY